MRQALTSAADLCPEMVQETLTVRIQRLSGGIHGAALDHL